MILTMRIDKRPILNRVIHVITIVAMRDRRKQRGSALEAKPKILFSTAHTHMLLSSLHSTHTPSFVTGAARLAYVFRARQHHRFFIGNGMERRRRSVQRNRPADETGARILFRFGNRNSSTLPHSNPAEANLHSIVAVAATTHHHRIASQSVSRPRPLYNMPCIRVGWRWLAWPPHHRPRSRALDLRGACMA